MKCDGERDSHPHVRNLLRGDIVNTLVCNALLLLLAETSVGQSVGWSLC
jgi:hypothetical protein